MEFIACPLYKECKENECEFYDVEQDDCNYKEEDSE